MRRPKDPDSSKPDSDDGKAPPGGRARERLDQFNRQRGLPTEPGPSNEDKGVDDAKRPPGKRSEP